MEPPGETHTLEVPEGVNEMYTLFHVTGAYVYVDPHGKAEKIEDVFTKLEVSVSRHIFKTIDLLTPLQMARTHFEKVGLGADYVDQFIR